MNNLEKAKELKRRYSIWEGKREGFIIKDEAKELLKEIEKGCGNSIKIDHSLWIKCGDNFSKERFYNFCVICNKSKEICEEILK